MKIGIGIDSFSKFLARIINQKEKMYTSTTSQTEAQSPFLKAVSLMATTRTLR